MKVRPRSCTNKMLLIKNLFELFTVFVSKDFPLRCTNLLGSCCCATIIAWPISRRTKGNISGNKHRQNNSHFRSRQREPWRPSRGGSKPSFWDMCVCVQARCNLKKEPKMQPVNYLTPDKLFSSKDCSMPNNLQHHGFSPFSGLMFIVDYITNSVACSINYFQMWSTFNRYWSPFQSDSETLSQNTKTESTLPIVASISSLLITFWKQSQNSKQKLRLLTWGCTEALEPVEWRR